MQVLKIEAVVTPLEDMIVQPFTGRVVRQILFKIAEKVEAAEFAELLSSKAPFKPYSMTPLYFNGRPLFKNRDEAKPLYLRRGREYVFRVCLIVKNLEFLKVLLGFLGYLELYGSKKAMVSIKGAEIFDETAIGLDLKPGKCVTVRFETPTLLQIPKIRKYSKVVRYMLFPVPSLLIYSLKKHWNAYAEDKVKIASWRANYALVPLDYRLKPITVIYDKKRHIRGFVGWVSYRISTKSKKLLKALGKLLKYGEFVNIGKSRSSGFGVVKISTQT